MKMNRNARITLIMTTAVCLAILATAAIINTIHGNENQALVIQSIIFAVYNIALNFALNNIRIVKQNAARKLVLIGKWSMPLASVVCLILQADSFLSVQINTETFTCFFVGIILIIVGNYFPKNHINYFVGLKFPWLFKDEEGWYKTHKLGSYTWIIAGLVLLVHPLHYITKVTTPLVIILAVAVPLVYSLVLYIQRQKRV